MSNPIVTTLSMMALPPAQLAIITAGGEESRPRHWLPRCKGVCEGLACFVGVQSCVRPVCAVMTAGPDGFRGRGPILLCGLQRPGHYGGLFSPPVRPVRHHFTSSSQPLRAK